MGVSVRLSRNTRAYFPFWLAIPVYFVVAAAWALIGLVWLLFIIGKAIYLAITQR